MILNLLVLMDLFGNYIIENLSNILVGLSAYL